MSEVGKRAEAGHDQAAANHKGGRFMANDELQAMSRDELFWDPSVDSDAVAVSANDGEVTL